jgi:tripartite-type tricarboxylate transporter receptor subunit TctC
LATAPNISTADEAGLFGFYASNWFALFAPAGTPNDVIAKLNGAVMSALPDPAKRLKFTSLGHEIFPHEQQTPNALRAFQKAEIKSGGRSSRRRTSKWIELSHCRHFRGETP